MTDPTPTTSAERACVCCSAVVTRETSPDPWDGRLDAYCEPCAWARCDAYPHDAPRPDLPDKAMVERRYKLLEGPVTVVDDCDEPTRVAYSAERVAALEAVAEAARRFIHVWDEPGTEGADYDARWSSLAAALAALDEHA